MTPETTTTAPVAIKTELANPPVVADNIVPKKIRILGVPLDLGASRRGVDMGPSAVRVAGDFFCIDRGARSYNGVVGETEASDPAADGSG